jgi:hypothetical protein
MITLVTGLWDIGRGELTEGWSRTFDYYLSKFESLLQVENNMIVFGDQELRDFVFKHRSEDNTQFIFRTLDWFKNNDFYQDIQNIRTNPDWYNQVGWLSESTQAKLEMYNPLVMSKMFLLHDAKILDKFNSDLLFWIDAGLSNTVHPGYFTHDKVLEKIPKLVKDFTFICFPYETQTEIHGFDFQHMKRLTNDSPNIVARGGFFGGTKEAIADMNGLYYNLKQQTLKNGFMGTEESLFTILLYQFPDLINYFEIGDDGMLWKFFEDVKNETTVLKNK